MDNKSPQAGGINAGPTHTDLGYAAVDLGSNSFHMVVARHIDGRVQVLDKVRDPVRLAAGLSPDGALDLPAQKRAFAALKRFAERLEGIPAEHVRAVGTYTLRKARMPEDFLTQCEEILGHPIGILPGPEEARLIYQGVAHTTKMGDASHLVVDIGGGSTECILGKGHDPLLANSLQMGCVAYSERFFAKGILSKSAMDAAITAAKLELQGLARQYRKLGWRRAIGTSGTIKAIGQMVDAEGLRMPEEAEGHISKDALGILRKKILSAKRANQLDIAGLSADRQPVIAGGVAILQAIFDSFELTSLQYCSSALRDGLLYALVGQAPDLDVSKNTVAGLMARYGVDVGQAQRVENTALELWAPIAKAAGLSKNPWQKLLVWACRLHEIGLSVAYSGYHKHGAYILRHAEMPGFLRQEKEWLAALVLAHRRQIRPNPPEGLAADGAYAWPLLVATLRLAVILNRSRASLQGWQPCLQVAPQEDGGFGLELACEAQGERPLTVAGLTAEQAQLERLGIALVLV